MSLVLPPAVASRLVTEDRCERCKHGKPTTQQGAPLGMLDCRRFPPQIIVPSPGQIVTLFPLTEPGATCGEFSKRIVLDS